MNGKSTSKILSFALAICMMIGLFQIISPPVVQAAGALAAPVLTAEGFYGKVKLSWNAVAGATSYTVYRSESKTGGYGDISSGDISSGENSTSYVDGNVQNEVPYFYYVVAISGSVTSDPSNTVQALPTIGHKGEYTYGEDAATITITSKTNDTVLTDKASLAGTVNKEGTIALFVNGTKVDEQQITTAANTFAFADFTIQAYANDVNLYFTEEETGYVTRKTFYFRYLRQYDMVVGDTEGELGGVHHSTLEAALAVLPAENAYLTTIFIRNGEYEGRVIVNKPNVRLIGEDSERTVFHDSISALTQANAAERNVMKVETTATGFVAESFTVENRFAYTNGSNDQADALAVLADECKFSNLRLISFQDTLLSDSSSASTIARHYFYKCTITGNMDFIYGRGTALFEDCDLVARYTPYKADCSYAAGRQELTAPYGFVFYNCRLLAEDGIAEDSYILARPWGEKAATAFIRCYMGSHIKPVGYGEMSGNNYQNARYSEYYSYGPGFAVNNDRPLITEDAAIVALTDMFFMGPDNTFLQGTAPVQEMPTSGGMYTVITEGMKAMEAGFTEEDLQTNAVQQLILAMMALNMEGDNFNYGSTSMSEEQITEIKALVAAHMETFKRIIRDLHSVDGDVSMEINAVRESVNLWLLNLVAEKLEVNSDAYADFVDTYAENKHVIALYDIYIEMLGDPIVFTEADKDNLTVEITIANVDAEGMENIQLMHVREIYGGGVLSYEPEYIPFEMVGDNVVFTVDSFSMFAVVGDPIASAVTPASLSLAVGDTATLQISLGTSYVSADISSSNPAVATVSTPSLGASGNVQVNGVATGSANVTVTFTGDLPTTSIVVPVTVTASQPAPGGNDPGDNEPGGNGPIYLDPPDDGDGSSGGGSGGGGGGSASGSATPPNAPTPVTLQQAIKAAQEAIKDAMEKGSDTANVKLINPGEIGLDILEAIEKATRHLPGGANILADSLTPDGKAVDVRIKLGVSEAIKSLKSGAITTLNLAASTRNAAAKQVKSIFETWYVNDLQTIHFEMGGAWGQPVQVAVKLDPAMTSKIYYFYSYDKATNRYVLISSPQYWIDANGYIHFTTKVAGDIVISEGPLERK
jgi:pectin methylesterase-like acyl-CoA thioesterase